MAHDDGEMQILAKINCSGKNCPTVYRKDEETLVIQGYVADNLFVTGLPDGEQAVEIPVALLRDLDV